MSSVRINVTLPPGIPEPLEEYAERTGLSISAAAALLIAAGLEIDTVARRPGRPLGTKIKKAEPRGEDEYPF